MRWALTVASIHPACVSKQQLQDLPKINFIDVAMSSQRRSSANSASLRNDGLANNGKEANVQAQRTRNSPRRTRNSKKNDTSSSNTKEYAEADSQRERQLNDILSILPRDLNLHEESCEKSDLGDCRCQASTFLADQRQ